MRSKLNYLTGMSLKRKIKTKWFLIANILLGLVIIGLFNIDSIITYFGGDFNEKTKVYIIDNTNEVTELFTNNLKSTSNTLYGSEDNKYEIITYDKTVDEAKKILEEEKNSIILTFDSSENTFDVKIITKEYMDVVDTQLLTTTINNTKTTLALSKSSISNEELAKIYSSPSIERVYLDEGKNSVDENMEMIMTSVFPVLILPFFMLVVFLVQMIGAEVNDEKTTRGMEIIISNVSPRTHFFSKIIAGNLFVIIQGALLVIFALIGLFIRNNIGGASISNGIGEGVTNAITMITTTTIGSNFIYIIILTIVLMLLTFLAYSLLAGILASMTTNTEDFQQLQTPIMIILLIGYYLSMMAGLFKGAIFIKVLSFIPLISAILSPSLLILGQIGIVEVLISLILMILFIYVLIKYGLRIYKVGILNYSSKDLWKKMFKAIKN